MLYDMNIALKYLPNLGWLIALCSLTVAGFLALKRTSFPSGYFIAKLAAFCTVVILVSGGIFNAYGYTRLYPVTYLAKDLASNTGRMEGTTRVAVEGIDKPGALNFGPYISLRPGFYRVAVRYKSTAPVVKEVGTFDVAVGMTPTIAATASLSGTDGAVATAAIVFHVSKHWKGEKFQFRSLWNGSSDLRVLDVRLERK
jgi:hypothetical protein